MRKLSTYLQIERKETKRAGPTCCWSVQGGTAQFCDMSTLKLEWRRRIMFVKLYPLACQVQMSMVMTWSQVFLVIRRRTVKWGGLVWATVLHNANWLHDDTILHDTEEFNSEVESLEFGHSHQRWNWTRFQMPSRQISIEHEMTPALSNTRWLLGRW